MSDDRRIRLQQAALRWLPWCALLVYVLPLLILGQDAVVRVHDNLDSDVVYRILVARSGGLLASDPAVIVPGMMGGLPRGCLPTGYNIGTLLYALLPPFQAWLTQELAVRAIAVAGMLLLLRQRLGTDPASTRAATFAAAAFGCAPLLSVYGLTVAGQPLLLHAWLELRDNRPRPWHFVLFALMPFWSSFVLLGPFLLLVLGAWWALDMVRRGGRAVWLCAIVLTSYGLAVILAEAPLFRLMAAGFASHRSTWDLAALAQDGRGAARLALDLLWAGHTHVGSAQQAVIALILPCGVLFGTWLPAQRRTALVIGAALLATAVGHGLWQWQVVAGLRTQIAPLRVFQADRFYFFGALCWAGMAALALTAVDRGRHKWASQLGILLGCAAVLWPFALAPHWLGMVGRVYHGLGIRPAPPLTWRRFFAENAFTAVKSSVGDQPVASLGLHPSIAWYNGMRTVDGYSNNYPLAYKHAWRKVIAGELARSDEQRRYFDAWGSRAYLLTAEPGPDYERLELDSQALCNVGARYVLAAGSVGNAAALGWTLAATVDDPDSAWKIRVFRLPCANPATGLTPP